ncbi:MAG: heme ABC exporter ATP-binding protein CcmA [bacterium]
MSEIPALRVEDLAKSFGVMPVLRGVSLVVGAKELVALVGPNGAGKTTFLRICATLARPSSGRVSVFGEDAAENGGRVRASVAYLAHNPGLYYELTARENLQLIAGLFDVKNGAERIEKELARFGLTAGAGSPVRTFSRGMRQRLALARIFVLRPPLILLDEPFTGLDSEGVEVLRVALAEYHATGGAVVMTTHRPEDEVLEGGRVVRLVRGQAAKS